MTEQQAHDLEVSTDMEPIRGTVDVDIPADVLWECFRHANWWPRWNPCMWWTLNDDLVLGQQLIWAFEPIQWWYLYRLPGVATLVEVDDNVGATPRSAPSEASEFAVAPGQAQDLPLRKVTWEITVLPGFYARHTYSVEDLGNGRARFGSWEQATGPTFQALKRFWLAHFVFVKDESLHGAQNLEEIYQRTGILDANTLPDKNYTPSIIQVLILLNIIVNVLALIGRLFKPKRL